jgi:ActD protein
MKTSHLYGVMAEFDNPTDLIDAVRRARQQGYRRMDAYSPMPIEGLDEEIGHHRTYLPFLVLVGGIFGAIGGFSLLYWIAVINYPMNIGGKPLNSWPAFIPITFETTILCAALAAVFGMLMLNGLPEPYHPVFNVPRFAFASRDRFFLCLEARDRQFDPQKTAQFLATLNTKGVYEVER